MRAVLVLRCRARKAGHPPTSQDWRARKTSVPTDEYGDIPAGTVAWKGPLTPGKYDIVIDVNRNEKYDEGIDALDDVDIEVTAGFFVIPELPFGTLMGIVTCFLALATFSLKRVNFRH